MRKLFLLALAAMAIMALADSDQAQNRPNPAPDAEFKVTLLRADIFVLGNHRTSPLLTPEIGGHGRIGKLKVNFFSFVDLTPRQGRTWNINVNSQTVSWTALPAVRFMAEEARTTRWAVRAGPGVDINQVPKVKKISGKVFKNLTVAWLKGLVNEPKSQVKVSYATRQWQGKGLWQGVGFFRFRLGNPNVLQPGLNYTRPSWRGVSLRVEYNKDRSGQRINFGPSLDLLRLFR